MALTAESLKPIYPKYDYKYTDRPNEACSTYLSDKNPLNVPPACAYKKEDKQVLCQNYGPGPLTTQSIDWVGKSRGLFFHYPPTNLDVICGKLSEDCKSPVPVICRGRTRTRCTQTRYRESSAQTRPYQPDIDTSKENYKEFEVYQLSKLLDSFEPPGEYEVKVVERARRRRQYERALEIFANDKKKHQTILEAMEWEDWVAREEDIQNCQMVRMEIVKRMFDQRQARLHSMSEKRMSSTTERIQAKRAAQLKKIDIEFARNMRRLEAKRQNLTRSYRKQNITQEHIDPASELYAPQMRFGVNPNRRHYVGFRRKFDDRIDDLDKQKDERGLASLICPFSKLRGWAKPKQRMMEVSQRFCSDQNLKNLYESLKGLRTIAETPRPIPKCLKTKTKPAHLTVARRQRETSPEVEIEAIRLTPDEPERGTASTIESIAFDGERLTKNLCVRRTQELHAKTKDNISALVGEFEGATMGKLLQFLNAELERLKQQKKFQAIHMLAERERWKREAHEAGRRQKENQSREDQEKLFKVACDAHKDTASLFLESVLQEEFDFSSEAIAEQKITAIACQIDDRVMERILCQAQDARNFDSIIVKESATNQVFQVAEKRLKQIRSAKPYEFQLRAIEEELYKSVENAFETGYKTPDGVSIVGEILDELIHDAVTYDFDVLSSSSASEFSLKTEVDEVINKLVKQAVRVPGIKQDVFTDSTEFANYLTAKREAKAIVRKLVKKTIPEERGVPESERIVHQTLSDTFNAALYEVECLKATRLVRNNEKLAKIIGEICNHMKQERPASEVQPKSSSDTVTDEESVKSIPSNIDIFEKQYDLSSDYSFITCEGQIEKTIYDNPNDLEMWEPQQIDHRHERYNIQGKVAKRYQQDEHGGVDVDSSRSSRSSEKSDSDSSSSDSAGSNFSYTDAYVHLVRSRMFSSPWLKNIHPDLQVEEPRISETTERTRESLERGARGSEKSTRSSRRSGGSSRTSRTGSRSSKGSRSSQQRKDT